MRPLRYALTNDGAHIAYAVRGKGPPLLLMPTIPLSHFQLQAQQPEYARVIDLLAEHVTLIRTTCAGLALPMDLFWGIGPLMNRMTGVAAVMLRIAQLKETQAALARARAADAPAASGRVA